MNYYGMIIGLAVLILTGIGHIIVIKGEYYFGTKIWPVFLAIGLISIILSFFVRNSVLSGVLGVTGVTFIWGIHELFKQKERVDKGWFPKRQ